VRVWHLEQEASGSHARQLGDHFGKAGARFCYYNPATHRVGDCWCQSGFAWDIGIATRQPPEPPSDKDDMIRHPCRCGSELGGCLALTHATIKTVLVDRFRRDHSSADYPATAAAGWPGPFYPASCRAALTLASSLAASANPFIHISRFQRFQRMHVVQAPADLACHDTCHTGDTLVWCLQG
jgi:hypothetical protein